MFFVGQLLSNSGNWLTTVAITLLVLHRTGSGSMVGLLAVCQYGPLLVLSPFGGLVADRVNKRRLLYVTQGLEMAESFALLGLLAARRHHLPATRPEPSDVVEPVDAADQSGQSAFRGD